MNASIERLSAGPVIHLRYSAQEELGRAFMRLQEFYESPFDDIRGRVFTVEQYRDRYTEGGAKPFDYFTKWNGFNVPGEVVNEFFASFRPLGWTEELLRTTIYPVHREKFYLIGTWREGEVLHELAHAYWYLDSHYRAKMAELLTKIDAPTFRVLQRFLRVRGYTPEVFTDEMQAYLSESTLDLIPYYAKHHVRPDEAAGIIAAARPFVAYFTEYHDRRNHQ